MRIGRWTNGIACEFEMQAIFKKWLGSKELKFIDEMTISEIGRRPDFLIIKEQRILINVEAKCINLQCMIEQLNDNAKYCNYSFAFIPDYTLTPKWFKEVLIEKGYGLIIYNYNNKIITEALESHVNKNVNNVLRRKIIERINNKLINNQFENNKLL